jgi:hypothetical protein
MSHVIIIEQPHSLLNKLPVFILPHICLWLYNHFLLDLGRFFNFLILYTVGMTPWTGISPSQGRSLHIEQYKHRTNTLSEIRTHDPSVRASKYGSCLRPRGHCDRLPYSYDVDRFKCTHTELSSITLPAHGMTVPGF